MVSVNWWEETEARVHRMRTPHDSALLLHQRMQAAGLDPHLSLLPAHYTAALLTSAADFIKLTESLLVSGEGDRAGITRTLAAIDLWASQAGWLVRESEKPFGRLLDSLQLDAEEMAGRAEAGQPDARAGAPEEQAKLDGRYRYWHLLYERLDLKLAGGKESTDLSRALAREIAEIYEECLISVREIVRLEKDAQPRFRSVARLMLDLNTTFHFHLGPHHLGFGQVDLRGAAVAALRSRILLYLGAS